MTDGPAADPMSAMQLTAVTHHELFAAYCAAGFTRPEAMDLLIAFIQSNGD